MARVKVVHLPGHWCEDVWIDSAESLYIDEKFIGNFDEFATALWVALVELGHVVDDFIEEGDFLLDTDAS